MKKIKNENENIHLSVTRNNYLDYLHLFGG